MNILDGKKCAESLIGDIAKKVAGYVESGLRKPHMTIILVGEHAPSESYVKSKIATSGLASFESSLIRFPATITEKELLEKIAEVNADPTTDGVIVQLPLPRHINQ